MKRNKTVEEFLESTTDWHDELTTLRKILLSTGLEETVKWGMPVYTHNGKNVVGISSFKSYFGLWFYQGALLADKNKVLINAQQGRTKAMRQWRMESAKKIKSTLIKKYVKEAAGLVDAGKEIKPDRAKPIIVPAALNKALAKNKSALACFNAMTKGKQREYTTYIEEAKRDETKLKRIEKIMTMILDGIGLHDKYR